jgi:hypothetical protein
MHREEKKIFMSKDAFENMLKIISSEITLLRDVLMQ